jgi:hypothetical protein
VAAPVSAYGEPVPVPTFPNTPKGLVDPGACCEKRAFQNALAFDEVVHDEGLECRHVLKQFPRSHAERTGHE